MVAPLLRPSTISQIARTVARLRPDWCEVVRDGMRVAEFDCRVSAVTGQAAAADPRDASDASTASRKVAFPLTAEIRVGDVVRHQGDSWTVGAVPSDSYLDQIERTVLVTRPTAAVPVITITLSTWDAATETRVNRVPQRVQVIYADRQQRTLSGEGAIATLVEGTVLEVEAPGGTWGDLAIAAGDRFTHDGRRHRITDVWTSGSGRVEATFVVDREAA